MRSVLFACLLYLTLPGVCEAACSARVKIIGSETTGNDIAISVRVYATEKSADRVVYYTIWGKVRAKIGGIPSAGIEPTEMSDIIYATGTTTVSEVDDYTDDVVYYSGPGEPVDDPKFQPILYPSCYNQ